MVDRGEFFLKGHSFKRPIEFSFNGYKIELTNNRENAEQLSMLKMKLALASETSNLTITGPAEEVSLRDVAVDIKNLLSIAIGRRIIFDRQVYRTGHSQNLVEKVMSKNENEGEQIIPDFEISSYLNTTLPVWSNFTKSQKDDIFTVTDYLNQTRHDFIEDRILRTVQAWECSANYWIQEPTLSDDLIALRERIKDTFKTWKNEKNYSDVDGELGKRLTSPLDQEKLMLRLDRLISESRLDVAKINLNLKVLKKLERLCCSHWTHKY